MSRKKAASTREAALPTARAGACGRPPSSWSVRQSYQSVSPSRMTNPSSRPRRRASSPAACFSFFLPISNHNSTKPTTMTNGITIPPCVPFAGIYNGRRRARRGVRRGRAALPKGVGEGAPPAVGRACRRSNAGSGKGETPRGMVVTGPSLPSLRGSRRRRNRGPRGCARR